MSDTRGYTDKEPAVLKRLKRIEGQVREGSDGANEA